MMLIRSSAFLKINKNNAQISTTTTTTTTILLLLLLLQATTTSTSLRTTSVGRTPNAKLFFF